MEYVEKLLAFKDGFKYEAGVTPLTDVRVVAALLFGYLGLSFALQAWMRDRKPMNVTGLSDARGAPLLLRGFFLFFF